METAGNKDFDSETEKKGLGTPATRAGIIEKLVSSGYAVRKGKQILPSTEGRELVNVMPAYLKAHQKDFMPEDTKAGQILDYLERYSGSIVCSKQLYKEALGHDYDEPKQWELREINDIMNNAVTGWRAFSNPRYFPEPYRRQKGWERIRNDNEPDNSMDGFQEIPTEEMEQLGLPEEWLKQK